MRRFLILCAAVALGAGAAFAKPQIAPLVESAWTQEQRDMVATYWKGAVGNDVRTFINHPTLVKGISPFAEYILNESTLPPRHRALLVLRAAALANSPYVWGKYVPYATGAGLSAAEVQRVAEGSTAKWPEFEATLLRAADELHDNSFISTPTWDALAKTYNTNQLIDATFTVAEFTMLSTTINSIGIEPDASFAKLPKVTHAKPTKRGWEPLAIPRVPILQPDQWTEEQARLVDPKGMKKPLFVVLASFVNHTAMYIKRQTISDQIRSGSVIPPRVREFAISRVLARTKGHAEWAGHLGALKAAGFAEADLPRLAMPGYEGLSPADAAIARAVDEIFDNDRISEKTWTELSAHFKPPEIIDIAVAAGGYRMVAMAINTFGVPIGGAQVPATMP